MPTRKKKCKTRRRTAIQHWNNVGDCKRRFKLVKQPNTAVLIKFLGSFWAAALTAATLVLGKC